MGGGERFDIGGGCGLDGILVSARCIARACFDISFRPSIYPKDAHV